MFQIMVSGQTHSDRVVLFDRTGNMRGSYRVLLPDQMAELETAVVELLNTPKPADTKPADTEPDAGNDGDPTDVTTTGDGEADVSGQGSGDPSAPADGIEVEAELDAVADETASAP